MMGAEEAVGSLGNTSLLPMVMQVIITDLASMRGRTDG